MTNPETSHIMLRRVEAAQATLGYFGGQPFAWGKTDCVQLSAWHLEQLGHTLPVMGNYATALGARGALRKAGFKSLEEALDGILPRITPAAVMVGDVVLGKGDTRFGALGIYLGNGALLGFHERADGAAVLRRVALRAAWSVL